MLKILEKVTFIFRLYIYVFKRVGKSIKYFLYHAGKTKIVIEREESKPFIF